MSDITGEMWAILAAWIVLLAAVFRLTIRSAAGSIGLPLAFMFTMTFFYCGGFTYLVPGYSHAREGGSAYLASYGFSEQTVLLGMFATLLGVAGFTIGSWAAGMRQFTARLEAGARLQGAPALAVAPKHRRALMSVLGGFALLSFLLNGVPIALAAFQALTQVGRNAAVVFICLGAALVVHADRGHSYARWVLLAAALPAVYLMLWGFVSYGFITLTIFAGFWLAVLASRRIGALVIGAGSAGIMYLLLSLFVAWMTFRDELRAVLWDERADFAARIGAVLNAFGKTELLSPFNFTSLDVLNTRLNQYVFVGKAIEWHDLFPHLQLYGQSIALSLLAWVPRALWPDKPEMGGNRFVSDHTGMRFSDTATFGAGPVFEFYVNFQYAGVLVGFAVLGLILRSIDIRGSIALREARLLDFARWFTLGIAFIAPLTDFFFIASTAVASWLVISVLRPIIDSLAGRGTPGRVGPVPRGQLVQDRNR